MNLYNKIIFSEAWFWRALLALLGFSVPISTALDNVLLALLLIFGLVKYRRDVLRIGYRNPVAQAALLLFGMLLIATFYGAAPLDEAFDTLGKYLDLAMIPLYIAVMRENQSGDSALNGFLLAMLLTLILSYLVGIGVLGIQPWMEMHSSVASPAIFRHQLTQNTFMALAIFFALLRMRAATGLLWRAAWGAFALLGIFNVLFMVQGRTGYVTLSILLGWFAWTTLAKNLNARGKPVGWRHAMAVTLAMALLVSGVYFFSARLQERVNLIVSDLKSWDPQTRSNTSVGIRMQFYYNTLQIIRQNPALGVGTGGLTPAYAQQDKNFDTWQVRNPHNEYLMVAVQTGIVGLALLLYLFYTQWRVAPLLESAFRQDAARGLMLATAADCLFNSPLLDHAPGLLFALMSATLFASLGRDQKRGE